MEHTSYGLCYSSTISVNTDEYQTAVSRYCRKSMTSASEHCPEWGLNQVLSVLSQRPNHLIIGAIHGDYVHQYGE